MQKIKKFLFTEKFSVAVLALLQILFLIRIVRNLYTAGTVFRTVIVFLRILIILRIYNREDMNLAYKKLRITAILVFPVAGVVLYVLTADNSVYTKKKKHMEKITADAGKILKSGKDASSGAVIDKRTEKQINFLKTAAGAPPYQNTSAEYYATGEEYFRDMLGDMEKAEKSIFIQCFIIDQGTLWDSVLKILKEKAAQGLDIRLIYDGMGCLLNFPKGYKSYLENCGIKVAVFDDIEFSFNIADYFMVNHRDHRKITVIDSAVAYSGGINISDEYVNRVQPFGLWKDTGFRLEGRRVQSFIITFLQTWEYLTGEKTDYNKFYPGYKVQGEGIVQPYSVSPFAKNNASSGVYLNIVNRAEDYVYIATPYLIIDNKMCTALVTAALSGVDVRIVLPGIPDKWYVYCITQSYYRILVDAGVKVYEYLPGFIHAKMYVSDDVQAVVGGANTDYRSLYLNFETCCSFYNCSMVNKVRNDFLDMFSQSHMVMYEDIENESLLKRLCRSIIKILGPLM